MMLFNDKQGSKYRCRQVFWYATGLLISGVLLFAANWEADRRERVRMNNFRGDVLDLARITESIIDGQFRELDNSLLVLRDAYPANPETFPEFVKLLREGPLKDPSLRVVIVDRDGYLAYTDTPDVKPRLYLGFRNYFRYFADGGKDRLYIDEPIFGQVTKRNTLPVVRPMYDKQGKFFGVAALSVTQNFLSRLGPPRQLSSDYSITVVNHGGTVVSRSRNFAEGQGTTIAVESLLPMLKSKEGVFAGRITGDGVEQVIAFRHVHHLTTSLIVYVESSPEAKLHDLARQRTVLTWSAIFISLIVLVLITLYLHNRKISSQLIGTLRKSKAREYEALTKTSIDGFSITDESARILDTNDTFCTMLGYPRDEILNLNLGDIEATGSSDPMADQLRSAIDHGGNRFQARLRRKDAAIVEVEISVQYVKESDGRFFIFVRDLTKQNQDEIDRTKLETLLQQAQKMESIGHLAGGMAHDFNNMLGVILGRADLALMKSDPANPFVPDLLEIQKAAERSADLTRQLLTFARKQAISPIVLDLNDTVAGMLKLLQRLLGENIQLVWHPAADLWPVKMDPSQIHQILANLCVNSRDAIAEFGNITIRTENRIIDENYSSAYTDVLQGGYVSLSVTDDGCGMDKQVLPHVFEPFFTTKGVGSGTGLGLSTVYGAVKQNGGLLNVYSEPGLGTTFTIFLPRVSAEVDSAQEIPARTPQDGSETILLVEDDQMLLHLNASMLENNGYTVLAAESPDDALSLAKQHAGPIHLLITDVIMPAMNGKELSNKLVNHRPEIKVLFMSGYSADIISHHGILDEGIHFLQKPVPFESLTSKVRAVLDQQ